MHTYSEQGQYQQLGARQYEELTTLKHAMETTKRALVIASTNILRFPHSMTHRRKRHLFLVFLSSPPVI